MRLLPHQLMPLVTSGNNTFVPPIVLMHGCHARIPAPEWGFSGRAPKEPAVCRLFQKELVPMPSRASERRMPLGNSLVTLSSSRKFSARAALVDLHDNSRSLLSECFRQFGIDAIPMSSDHAPRLAKEKFEACVVRVGSHAENVLESARSSRSNSRMVIYGLGGAIKDAMKLSKFGVNAVFQEPL